MKTNVSRLAILSILVLSTCHAAFAQTPSQEQETQELVNNNDALFSCLMTRGLQEDALLTLTALMKNNGLDKNPSETFPAIVKEYALGLTQELEQNPKEIIAAIRQAAIKQNAQDLAAQSDDQILAFMRHALPQLANAAATQGVEKLKAAADDLKACGLNTDGKKFFSQP